MGDSHFAALPPTFRVLQAPNTNQPLPIAGATFGEGMKLVFAMFLGSLLENYAAVLYELGRKR
jgi:hypothetical protein